MTPGSSWRKNVKNPLSGDVCPLTTGVLISVRPRSALQPQPAPAVPPAHASLEERFLTPMLPPHQGPCPTLAGAGGSGTSQHFLVSRGASNHPEATRL